MSFKEAAALFQSLLLLALIICFFLAWGVQKSDTGEARYDFKWRGTPGLLVTNAVCKADPGEQKVRNLPGSRRLQIAVGTGVGGNRIRGLATWGGRVEKGLETWLIDMGMWKGETQAWDWSIVEAWESAWFPSLRTRFLKSGFLAFVVYDIRCFQKGTTTPHTRHDVQAESLL